MLIHLAIDGVGAKFGGAATVLRELLDAALRNPAVGPITLFCSPGAVRTFALPTSERLQVREEARAESGRFARLLWLAVGLPAAVRRSHADVLLCMNGAGIGPSGVPTITFVQQSLPFSPEALARCSLGTRMRMKIIRTAMGRSCRRAAVVLVQTPTMRSWVASAFLIDPNRICVVTPGAPPLPKPAMTARAVGPMRRTAGLRLLYVGSDSAYKNLPVVLEALSSIRRDIPDTTLFMTLPPGHALARRQGVVGLGYLPREVLAEAYALATALIMPSLVETVGLPMIEAMSAGTAVIAADRPYAHDVCADSARYFDPLDSHDLARAARELADGERREELGRRGRRRAAELASGRAYDRAISELVEVARRRPGG